MVCKSRYLNTDLDLASAADLTLLTEAFVLAGFIVLNSTQSDEGIWYATFETGMSFDDPDCSISAFLDFLDSLKVELQALWMQCTLREFNIGFDCGREPWAFNQGLSSKVLGRMGSYGASLRITLYPERSELDVNHGQLS